LYCLLLHFAFSTTSFAGILSGIALSHPLNVYPSFVGSVGIAVLGISSSYAIDVVFTTVSPFLNVKLYDVFVYPSTLHIFHSSISGHVVDSVGFVYHSNAL
jgi:hypothetical protein